MFDVCGFVLVILLIDGAFIKDNAVIVFIDRIFPRPSQRARYTRGF